MNGLKNTNVQFSAEDVGFQRLYESLLAQGITVIIVKQSFKSCIKASTNESIRVWFEQKKVVFPYGDDETRRAVNLLLDELDTHVWKDGGITDVGKHNDIVMAFEHAVDQMTHIDAARLPMATKTVRGVHGVVHHHLVVVGSSPRKIG